MISPADIEAVKTNIAFIETKQATAEADVKRITAEIEEHGFKVDDDLAGAIDAFEADIESAWGQAQTDLATLQGEADAGHRN